MTTAKTMAEVLIEHQRHNASSCLCGWAKLGRSHPEHQADALTAAGFGDVRESAAGALESAGEDLDLPGSDATGYYAYEQESGYREAERHAESWLRARAAAVRGDS